MTKLGLVSVGPVAPCVLERKVDPEFVEVELVPFEHAETERHPLGNGIALTGRTDRHCWIVRPGSDGLRLPST